MTATTFVFDRDIKLVVAGVPVTTSLRRGEVTPAHFCDSGCDPDEPAETNHRRSQLEWPRWNSRKRCLYNDSHGSRGRKPIHPRRQPGAKTKRVFLH